MAAPLLQLLQLTALLCSVSYTTARTTMFDCTTSTAPATWSHLRSQLSSAARLLLPGSAGYAVATQQYARGFTRTPYAVVQVANTEDVSVTVQFARAQGVCVSVKSSGHSMTGQAVLDKRITIDTGMLNSSSFNMSTGVATVGPGLRLLSYVKAAQTHGVYSPWGGCPSVAMGGYLTGGGEGAMTATLGLAVDQVLGYTVVLANGSIAQTDANTLPDLFWALRGGHGPGPNFGIVTSVSLQTHPAPKVLTAVRMTAVGFNDSMALSLAYMQHLAATTRDDLAVSVIWTPMPGGVVHTTVSGWVYGSTAVAKAAVAPLVASAGVKNVSFEEGDVFSLSLVEFNVWAKLEVGYWGSHSGYASSPFNEASLTTLLHALEGAPSFAMDGFNSVFWFPKTGAALHRAPNATAYPAHAMLADVEIVFACTDMAHKAALQAYCLDLYSAITPALHQPLLVYANLPDVSLRNPLSAYYGAHLPRLRSLKHAWDPQNYLQFPQSVW